MRTTIRIDDQLLDRLKEHALRKRMSLTRLVNQILRAGLQADRRPTPRKRPYHEKTYPLGTPLLRLDKAMALAARFEDEEIIRKLALRK